MDQPSGASGRRVQLDDFVALVNRHRTRVERVRSVDGDDLEIAVLELGEAHEELRAAEDEMRSQREQIDALREQRADERARRERAAALPLLVVVTDGERGTADAEVAASFLLGDESRRLRAPLPDLGAAMAFAELCRLSLTGAADLRTALGRIAVIGREAVPAAAALSVSFGDPASPELIGTESPLAQAVDGAQIRAGEGPCADAFRQAAAVRTDDLRTDPRWPSLAPLVADLDVGGVLAVPVLGPDRLYGVLNLYAARGRTFDHASAEIAGLLGSAVAGVIEDNRSRESLRQLSEQLQRAMESRAVIEQAKGMLMVLHGLDADAAFARLVSVSRASNVKLREVAQRLVDTGAGAGTGPG